MKQRKLCDRRFPRQILTTMKKKSILTLLTIALVAMAACSNDDNEAAPATEEQMHALSGHWYAELPISGQTDNWRTEEEGDSTDYDHIGTLVYLNGYVTDFSYWGYIYLQNGEMVNFDGIDRMNEDASFDFTMTTDGYITPLSHLANAPKVTDMHWDSQRSTITAQVSYNGQSRPITFTRPTDSQQATLNNFFEMLVEAGMVGYEDGDAQQRTDITDSNASEPSRARHR